MGKSHLKRDVFIYYVLTGGCSCVRVFLLRVATEYLCFPCHLDMQCNSRRAAVGGAYNALEFGNFIKSSARLTAQEGLTFVTLSPFSVRGGKLKAIIR